MHTTPLQDAYLAGLIDGEGHLRPYVGRGSGRVVSFVNTHRPVIDWVLGHYGGAADEVPPPQPHHKLKWCVRWTSKADIAAVLDAIEPYAIIKREAISALRLDLASAPGSGSPGVRRRSECKRGHDITGAPVGAWCPECKRQYYREYRRKR